MSARRLPFTLGLVGVVLAFNAAAGTLREPLAPDVLHLWGLGLEAIERGQLERLLTAIPLSHDRDMLVRQVALAALVVGAAEYRFGTRRALVVFVATDVLGSLALMAGVWAWRASGSPYASALAASYDVGLSGGAFGLLGLLAASLPGRARAAVVAAIVLALAFAWWTGTEPLADALHPITFGLGLLAHAAIPSTGSHPVRA